LNENGDFSEIPSSDLLFEKINKEIERLSKIKTTILNEKLSLGSIIVLIIAVVFNIWGLSNQAIGYMAIWISASLYFYIFYPLLPLFLFPFRYVLQMRNKPKVTEKKKSVMKWAKEIHIFKNKRVGFRLFMRFFILSLLPLTIGMLFIYLLSMTYSLILGYLGVLPPDTYSIIVVQCLGIVLFYLEMFFFRAHLLHFTKYVMKQSKERRKGIILLGIIGAIFLAVGTIVVILLIIAILLPGFTLAKFINVNEFLTVRTNIMVPLVLVSQIIIVQFLQNVLSLKIARDMCDDLLLKLDNAKDIIRPDIIDTSEEITKKTSKQGEKLLNDVMKTLRETELYAINRRQMFKLFPTYSIGINLPGLFNLENLSQLEEIFSKD